jgi:kynurenine formamidase
MVIPRRIFDLSQPIFNNCPQYPDLNPRPAAVRLMYIQAVQGVNKEIVEISTHTGTHCDAPFHFFVNGRTIDQVPLEYYVAPAVIADLRYKTPGSEIDVDDVKDLKLEGGEVVLLNTGWGHKRANVEEFLTNYVFLGRYAAEHLVQRNVAGVGIDAVSLGGYNDRGKAAPPHEVLLGADKFIVEELFFPDEVMDGKQRLFVAFPVKLQGCGAAWTRATLWEV